MKPGETREQLSAEHLPGTLMKLRSPFEWHNAHILDSGDRIIGELHFRSTDRALFIEPYVNRFQPDVRRCKCLVGSAVVMFSAECLEVSE